MDISVTPGELGDSGQPNESDQSRRSPPGPALSAINWPSLRDLVGPFDRDELCGLTATALDSPGGGHRLPSLALLWIAGLRVASGSDHVGLSGLRQLLVGARRAAPELAPLEDCWLSDPRLFVRWPVGRRRLRIHPGAFTDPLQLLRVVDATAEAIDDFVLAAHGFTLSDLIEVALTYGDWRLTSLAPHWADGTLPRDASDLEDESLEARVARIAATPIVLQNAEIAARSIRHDRLTTWTASCVDPHRAAAAWAWATVDVDKLDMELSPGAAMFGRALSIRGADRESPVPASMVLSSLAAGTAILAAEAAHDEAAVRRLQIGVERQAVRLLNLPSPPARRWKPVRVPERVDPAPDFAGFVALPAERRALVVKVVTALDPEMLNSVLVGADDELLALDVQVIRRLGVPLDPTGLVLPLVVYGGPYHEPSRERGPVAHLHVEDLMAMVQDLDQDRLDRDVLLQFLEELVSLPGVDHFLSFDAADVWRHWRHFGALNPTGETGIALAVDPRPDDVAWTNAAAWEPVETVLSGLGLPPASYWSSARRDERGYATLFSADKEAFLVLTQPDLVVRTTLENPLPSLRIDASFAFGVADGIFLTLANRPETARLLCTPLVLPLLVNIDFTADRQPGVDDERIAIGWRTSHEPLPIIDLLLGPDWLELLAEDATQAHRVIGDVLLVGLEALAPPQDEEHRDRVRSPFLEAWCSAPPLAMLHFQETIRDYRPERAFVLPRTFASRATAERLIAQEVLRVGTEPCALTDGEARRFVREHLLPLVDNTLESLLATWAPDALLAVAEQLNDAYGERTRAVAEVERALAAPWAATWQTISRSAPEESEMTRPLDLLLERLLITSLSGSVLPDRFDIAQAADLVACALEMTLALDSAERRLHGLGVMVAKDGRVAVIPGPASRLHFEDEQPVRQDALDFDLPGYLRADRDDRLRIRDEQRSGDPSVLVRIDGHSTHQSTEFERLADLPDIPPRLLAADALLRTRCGTGIDGLHAILGTAVTWNRDDDHVELVAPDNLRRAAAQWAQLPLTEIDSAIERLTLDPRRLGAEGISYAAQERRHNRLAIQPLPLVDGQIVLMPWRIVAAQGTYAGYLEDGRLPWHPADLPDDVRNAFIHYREIANHALEHAALDVARQLSLPSLITITPAIAATTGLGIPGEIDLLVADPETGRLWVCEVKDLYGAVSPQMIERRIDKFIDPKRGFVYQLDPKRSAVERNPDAALTLLAVPTGTQPWRALSLMVTRRVEPAAFVDGVGVPFVVIEDLAKVLSEAADPFAGHAPVGAR